MDDKSKVGSIENIILFSLSFLMAMLLYNRFSVPTIGNVFPSPLDGISLDWNCIERHNCSGCLELHWDTGWCYDCILSCKLSDAEIRQAEIEKRQKETQAVVFFSGLAILPALVFFIKGIMVKQDKPKIQLVLSIILFILGIATFFLMKP